MYSFAVAWMRACLRNRAILGVVISVQTRSISCDVMYSITTGCCVKPSTLFWISDRLCKDASASRITMDDTLQTKSACNSGKVTGSRLIALQYITSFSKFDKRLNCPSNRLRISSKTNVSCFKNSKNLGRNSNLVFLYL